MVNPYSLSMLELIATSCLSLLITIVMFLPRWSLRSEVRIGGVRFSCAAQRKLRSEAPTSFLNSSEDLKRLFLIIELRMISGRDDSIGNDVRAL